jgi:hypothetical protein
MKKSVSFVIPENLFSEEDYAAAVALQEAETGNDSDDEHDYARTLGGAPSLPPFLQPNAHSSVFHPARCHLSLPPHPPHRLQIYPGCCFGATTTMAWYVTVYLLSFPIPSSKFALQVDHAAAVQLAAKGDALGCLWCKAALALCYLCGWGVKQDTDLALYLAEESASTGYGQFCLGFAPNLLPERACCRPPPPPNVTPPVQLRTVSWNWQ